jgi:hypothetical protein
MVNQAHFLFQTMGPIAPGIFRVHVRLVVVLIETRLDRSRGPFWSRCARMGCEWDSDKTN